MIKHDHTLSSHRTDASYARDEKRWSGGGKYARHASKAYNKALRSASRRFNQEMLRL
jgi:hypothetical protein